MKKWAGGALVYCLNNIKINNIYYNTVYKNAFILIKIKYFYINKNIYYLKIFWYIFD